MLFRSPNWEQSQAQIKAFEDTWYKYQFQWWAVSLVNAVPYGGKKKSADTGIDGIIYLVKGGVNMDVAMLKDLIAAVDRKLL